MPRRTNPFQQLITSIMFAVKGFDYEIKESVLTDKDIRTGSIREMDIILINRRNPADKILIECRAHKRKQSVEWIDTLIGKSLRLGYKKVIAVSSSGFYKPTLLEAKERNIETLTLNEVEEVDWKRWFFALTQITVNKVTIPRITSIIIHNEKGKRFFISDPENVRFLKADNKEWLTVLNFIKSQAKEILRDFEEKRKPNEGTKIIYESLLTNLLFQFNGNDDMHVAAKLELHIEEYNDVFSIPLKAYTLGGEKLLIGEKVQGSSKFELVLDVKNNHQLQIGVKEQGFKKPC